MSNLANIQRKLSEGISGWLLFEFHCLRGTLFNEKYLSYPIGQILNSITEYKTLTEISHPCGNEVQGRPLQIDFVLKDIKDSSWKFAIESKWAGNSTISMSSIIWDLIRLQNLFTHHPDIHCYFILSGLNKKLSKLLKNEIISIDKIGSTPGNITKINSKYLTFNLNKLDNSSKKIINESIIKYPNFSLYSQINCRPAHLYPKTDLINMSFSTYSWEILAPDKTLKTGKLV